MPICTTPYLFIHTGYLLALVSYTMYTMYPSMLVFQRAGNANNMQYVYTVQSKTLTRTQL